MTTIGNLIARIIRMHERASGRRLLLEMNDRLLKDIGLDPGRAKAEAAKSWWRA